LSEVFTRLRSDHFERWQDCEPIVENNKKLQNETQKGDFHHIADIPNVIIEKWINEDGVSYRELMSPDGMANIVKKKLRDPDWAWLRTTSKRF
jgi:hypothetical protein